MTWKVLQVLQCKVQCVTSHLPLLEHLCIAFTVLNGSEGEQEQPFTQHIAALPTPHPSYTTDLAIIELHVTRRSFSVTKVLIPSHFTLEACTLLQQSKLSRKDIISPGPLCTCLLVCCVLCPRFLHPIEALCC